MGADNKTDFYQYGALQPNGHMNTRSLRRFNLEDPQVDTIDLEDICYGIGYKPHYSGQTPYFFSVAQHSILVARRIYIETGDALMALVALFHDSEECYIGDMITQIKVMFPEFKELAKKIQKVIFQKFDLPFEKLPEIKWADIEVLKMEFEIFYRMGPSERESFFKINPGYAPQSPDESAQLFFEEYNHFKKLLSIQ